MELPQGCISWLKYRKTSFVSQSFLSLCTLPQAHDIELVCLGAQVEAQGLNPPPDDPRLA